MSKSIIDLATELSRAFIRDKRTNGDEFVKLKDGSPQWMTDVIRECHAGTLPDDTIYSLIEKCADQLAEMDDDATVSDAYDTISEIEAEIYTHKLVAWLNGNVHYMTQALEEGEYKDGDQLLMAAQLLHIQEIGNTLVAELETLADNSDDESEVA